jgi:hypothetical protein
VRKRLRHYDPTWIRWNWNPEDLAYYQMLQQFKAGPSELQKDSPHRVMKWANDILSQIKSFASEWKLKLP